MDDKINYYIIMILGMHKRLNTKGIADKIPCANNTLNKHLKYLRDINVLKSEKEYIYRMWTINYDYMDYLKKKDIENNAK